MHLRVRRKLVAKILEKTGQDVDFECSALKPALVWIPLVVRTLVLLQPTLAPETF